MSKRKNVVRWFFRSFSFNDYACSWKILNKAKEHVTTTRMDLCAVCVMGPKLFLLLRLEEADYRHRIFTGNVQLVICAVIFLTIFYSSCATSFS